MGGLGSTLAGFDLQTLSLAGLAMVAVAGVAYVFLYPVLSGQNRVEKRRKAIGGATPQKRAARVEVSKREQVAASLKELDERQKRAKRPPITVRIRQAGLEWSKQTFIKVSIGAGLAGLALGFFLQGPAMGAAGALIGGLGMPRWYLGLKKRKRLKAFGEEFPNALDVITRGVKAGLPIGDCFRIIAQESQEPVRGEFRAVMETQTMGIPLADAVLDIYERMPCQEANFFGIVISIQQRAGGNLSEALGNLSKVLRERKKMRAKVKAVSSEAKASAGIIGALPIAVMTIVYVVTPTYISQLWHTQAGLGMLGCAGLWMAAGIGVMAKMINFEI